MSRRGINDKDSFCYICSKFVFKGNRKSIDEFYMKAYYTYFKIKLGDEDKIWAPQIICNSCEENL